VEEERALIEEALSGSTLALQQLVRLLQPVIHVRAARVLSRYAPQMNVVARQEIADMTQEVFTALFANQGRILRDWDPRRGASLKNFIGLVAERHVSALLRSKQRMPLDAASPDVEASHESISPERRLISQQTLSSVLQRLRSAVSPLGFQIFVQLYVEERSVAEVSESDGLTVAALHQWQSRLRKTASEILADLQRDEPSAVSKRNWETGT
jgi:RNA polymerase sigma factor (sigma-70 family)